MSSDIKFPKLGCPSNPARPLLALDGKWFPKEQVPEAEVKLSTAAVLRLGIGPKVTGRGCGAQAVFILSPFLKLCLSQCQA